MTDGLLLADKPAGWTSHDVVAKVRRLAGVRRVGHAGTLDPMATGLLVLGLGRATRLLGHLTLADKEYVGTIRLGVTTTTDDAEGEVLAGSPVAVREAVVRRAVRELTGELDQVPPAYSAVKVGGRRAYAVARAGADVPLAPRRVLVRTFDVLAMRGSELDVRVVCSSGTYIRALARDLGTALGAGAHLSTLRRTRVGPFRVDAARTVEQLAERLEVVPLDAAVAAAFPRRDVGPDAAQRIAHGARVPLPADTPAGGPLGVFAPDGSVVALVEARDGEARPLVVFGEGRAPPSNT